MQTILLIIFVTNLSYNNVQSVICYNCTNCSSTTGTILTGCSACGTIVYGTYTQKICAKTCSAGSYEGGYLSCCSTDFCNYNTPTSSSFISCYECPTCSSSSLGSKTSGCLTCGTIAYSSYVEKRCLASCSEGKYQGGYMYCCNSSYCNKNYPTFTVSCYECSQCSLSPGVVSFGCVSCATVLYSTYTTKKCTQFCSAGRYEGGYLYCCNSDYCNYNTPLNLKLLICLFIMAIIIFWLLIRLTYYLLHYCAYHLHVENIRIRIFIRWLARKLHY